MAEDNIAHQNCDEFEISRPHNAGRLYNWLLKYKFKSAVNTLPFALEGKSVLDVCCGSGMFSEFYAGAGASIKGIELSSDAVLRARKRADKYNFKAEFISGDATKLPFNDNSFDLVSVHDGLHHIPEPEKAVGEMLRVARKAVIIIEPAKSLLTEIAILLGISLRYEGPDFVYRLTEKETSTWLETARVKKSYMKRYLMYYPHKPGYIFRIFDFLPFFEGFKIFYHGINILLGKWGNKIQIVALKSGK